MVCRGKNSSVHQLIGVFLTVFIVAMGFPGPTTNAYICGDHDKKYNQGRLFMPLRPDLIETQEQLQTIDDGFKISALSTETADIPDGSIKTDPTASYKSSTLAPSQQLMVPQTGEKRSLVILIQFPDRQFSASHNKAYYQDLLFSTGDSMRSYYLEQSYGQMTVNGTVLGPYTSNYSISHYAYDGNGVDTGTSGSVNIYELTREAVQLARVNNPGFSWGDYDVNGDGKLDAVTIIHAGSGQEETGSADPNHTIWSHMWWIPGGETVGTKQVYTYTMDPEDGELGVFCHEFGHVLGLPDLYDTDYYKAGAGKWDLMGSGGWNGILTPGDTPAGLSAWCRHYLGWLNYTIPTQDQKDVTVRPLSTSPDTLQLWTGGNSASTTYFLVENRQQTGYDAALPGKGLLVWWVNNPDGYVIANTVNSNGNSRLIPVEADNLAQLWSYPLQKGDAGDPFPGSTGNTAFTCTSAPDSLGSNNAYTGVSLWNIHFNQASPLEYITDLTVNDGLILEPRTTLPSTLALDGSTAVLNTVLLNNNTRMTVDVRDSSNNVVRTLLNSTLVTTRGSYSVAWDGCDNNGEYVAPGSYSIRMTASINNNSTIPSASYSLPITTIAGISNKCNVTGVTVPGNATVSGTAITGSVENGTTAVTINATVSSNATWKLFSDAACTNEIADKTINLNVGANTAYIKVTAQDSVTTKIYTLTVARDDLAVISFGGGGGGGGGAVAEETASTISTKGGTVSDQGATITVPANAMDQEFTVKIEAIGDTVKLPSVKNGRFAGDVLEITKDISGTFKTDISIALAFKPTEIDQYKEQVSLFWLDENTKQWVELSDVTVDYSTGTVTGKVNHFTKFAVIATSKVVTVSNTLNDIKGHWAETNINKLVEAGVINGYADGSFKPDNNITRAEFTVVLNKAFKINNQKGKVFSDTLHHWAKDYIASATAEGVVNGYNEDSFGPDDLITREQMAVMIAKALDLKPSSRNSKFNDVDLISPWAHSAVAAASEAGIIKGYNDSCFKPQNKASRGEAVTMILNALNSMGK